MHLIQKAKEMVKSVIYYGKSRETRYYKFDFDESLMVSLTEDKGIKYTCCCKFHSVKDPYHQALCSYVISCILYLAGGKK